MKYLNSWKEGNKYEVLLEVTEKDIENFETLAWDDLRRMMEEKKWVDKVEELHQWCKKVFNEFWNVWHIYRH